MHASINEEAVSYLTLFIEPITIVCLYLITVLSKAGVAL